MPIPIIPLIGAGASILGNVLTGASNARQNRLQREYNDQMYARQRQDALSDWTMQNDYNSPQSQMQRLRDAKLNPNLVYGKGADNTSGVVRSTPAESWRPEATKYDFSGVQTGLQSMYDIKLKEAQTDNLKTQNTVMIQDALLKAAQTASTAASQASTEQGTVTSKFNLKLAEDLRNNTIEAAEANLRKINVDTGINLESNERANVTTAQSLQKGAEEILSLRLARAKTSVEISQIKEQINSIRQDVRIKQLDIDLKKYGVQPGDALWQRALARILSKFGYSPTEDELRKKYNIPPSPLIRKKEWNIPK